MKEKTRLLPVPLTEDEQRIKGRELGTLIQRKRDVESAFEDVKAKHKAEIKDFDAKIISLSEQAKTGIEYRQVPVVEEFDFEERVARTLRQDTREVVGTRALEPHEMQRPLPAAAGK